MELIPTLVIVVFGSVFAVAGWIAGAGRGPGGVHAAEPAPGARRD